MALTTTETQVTWPTAASSITVSSATEQTSETFTLDDTCVAFSLQVYADNQGTPADGDTAVFRLQWDVGETTAGYDTSEHAQYLGTLDTYATNTPGEDPAGRTYHLGGNGARDFKLAVTCANAATRNIVCRARVIEQRAA